MLEYTGISSRLKYLESLSGARYNSAGCNIFVLINKKFGTKLREISGSV